MNLAELLPIIALPVIILLYALYVIVGHYRAKKKKIKKDPLIDKLEKRLKEIKER